MAFVDLTLFTKSDPASDMTVTSSKVDVSTMRQDSSGYLNETATDLGVADFGDITHLFEVYCDSGSGLWGYGIYHGIGDENGSPYTNWNNGFFGTFYEFTGGGLRMRADRFISGSWTSGSDTTAMSWDTLYYAKAVRVGATMTYSMYSDSDRTTLVGSYSISGGPTAALPYIVAAATIEFGGPQVATWYGQNYDLGIDGGGGGPEAGASHQSTNRGIMRGTMRGVA
jgi:hypothetical protein